MDATSIRILLIEDNDADALLLENELQDSPFGPFSITHVETLGEGLAHLRENAVDVILSDLGLPDSQGLETVARICRENPSDIPVVVLTGSDDQTLGLRAMQLGAQDYLCKSGSHGSTRAVRYAIERKRANQAILHSQQQLAMAVDAAELGIFQWDLTTAAISLSFHSERLLGLEPGEFDGTVNAFEQCIHPEDRTGMSLAVDRSLQWREEYRHEYRTIRPGVSQHWIEARGKVFKDEKGVPARVLGTLIDITNRKAAEEAAKAREAELTRLDRAHLTPRELALLKLVVAGLPNKRIATDLNISVTTVAKHRAHLMAKTQALNAADLARISTLAGIIPST